MIPHTHLYFVLSMGLKLKKIHTFLLFTEETFMSNWVRKSTGGKIQASKNKDPCLKAFYKLTVNTDFGKICEKLEVQCNFHVVSNLEDLQLFL